MARTPRESRPDAALLEAVGVVYQAALEPGLWPAAVDAVRRSVNADQAFMLSLDVMPEQGGLLAMSNVDPALFSAKLGDVLRDNPFLDAWEAKGAPSCELFRAWDLVPEADIQKWSMYGPWAQALEFHYTIATVIYERQPFLTPKNNLNLFRKKDTPEFTEREMETMRLLLPHVQRSLLLHWRLRLHERRQQAVQEVLDRLALGVILLNREGRVAGMNAAAERIARAGGALTVRQDAVDARQSSEGQALRQLVAQVAATGEGRGVHPGGTVRLHGDAGDADGADGGLLVLATPLCQGRSQTRWLGDDVCAALFLSDPEAQHPLSVELLQQWFGLTPAESQVAVDLMNGLGAAEIAARRRVSEETVRTQTKAIYDKTGVSGRGKLAGLLLRSPAAMVRGTVA